MCASVIPFSDRSGYRSSHSVGLYATNLKRERTKQFSHRTTDYLISRRAASFQKVVLNASQYPQNADLPPVLTKRKKKPYPRPVKEIIREARKEKAKRLVEKATDQERILYPPENGLLVPELIPVAHELLEARKTLIRNTLKLLDAVPVFVCRYCPEVHIGSVGNYIRNCSGRFNEARRGMHDWIRGFIDDVLVPVESFHLFDRLRCRISHEQRFQVDRIPAVVELCIQAGVDIPGLPTLRRTEPIRIIGGRIIDPYESEIEPKCLQKAELSKDLDPCGLRPNPASQRLSSEELKETAEITLDAWNKMRSRAKRLMSKYRVRACGYCLEVHVGPRGHRVKLCGNYKHQWRDGKHGWQQATLDDLIPPNYVWHVKDPDGPPLQNELRKFYGKAPAIVELCVQAGAKIPERDRPLMRVDVVLPETDEVKMAA